MSDDLTGFWIHTIAVEAYLGQASNGSDSYAVPVPVICFVEETNRLVRSVDGALVDSSAQAYAPADTVIPKLDSRITLPSGRTTQLVSVSRFDSGDLDLPDHVVLNLE